MSNRTKVRISKKLRAIFFLLTITFIFYLFYLVYAFSKKEHKQLDSQKLLSEIAMMHLPLLKNSDIEHPLFVVCFSGTPGMGKTSIAQALEAKFQAIRISTDQLREIIRSLGENPDKRDPEAESGYTLLEKYLCHFFYNLLPVNKLIILDASIDRTYKKLFPLFKKNNVKYVVIRLEVPYEKVVERIKTRGKEVARFLKNLDRWFADYQNFGEKYQQSYQFNNYDNTNFQELFDLVERNLKQ